MSVQNVTAVPPANPARTKLERFQHALRNVEPSKSKKRDDAVMEAYDTIREHHERKVPWKTITAMFNEAYGLKMHPARLRKAFDEEGARRRAVYGIAELDQSSGTCSDIPDQRGKEGIA